MKFNIHAMLRNITLRIEEDTLKKGRHIAVEQGKSLSRWVTEIIEINVQNQGQLIKARNHALKTIRTGVHLGKGHFSREKAYE